MTYTQYNADKQGIKYSYVPRDFNYKSIVCNTTKE